ncbi:MAG TPA: hypothetical protein VMY39_05980, partial [Planctomycetota bacterium]|nr:hypothetical protein [Planctomycetota bacterium]
MRRTVVLAWVLLASTVCYAGEIGFEEDFALAKDRTVPLAQLIPGTEDYYFYQCLHFQNTGQLDKVDEMLVTWIRRYNRTARVVEMENRQALLKYDRDPAGSLDYLRRKLGLQFNHQRERLDQRPNLPTRLDPVLISRANLTRRAFAQHTNTTAGFEDAALDRLVAQPLSGEQRRDLLRRLKPELLADSNFVNAWLTKLHPSADVDREHDVAEREAYDNRLWSFVSRLAPAFNSLKANVLYHRLVHDRERGVYDKDRFMEYIKLPRVVPYANPKYLDEAENRRYRANLGADYRAVTLMPPVRSDEELVRSYLAHFFLTENDYAPYAVYVNDVYLKHLFAETKILNGLGDMEKWYSMLPPAEYKALKDRVDIDFAWTNPVLFAPDDEVRLDVFTKNVEKLIVRVFEINTVNYYRDLGREVDTDVNLDGLVANSEQVHTYTEPALRRVKRTFAFPGLKQRGVYVVEFIGNGKSSRALLRKGRFRHLVRSTTAGHVFTVLDEQNRKIDDATIWLGGHEYTPEQDGTITVPFSNQPGSQTLIIRRGDFASLAPFQHETEDYDFVAGLYVDREMLLSGRTATLVVRPALYLNDTPVTLSV